MTAKIRELNFDDLKNVSGGVTLLATATPVKVPASVGQLAAPSTTSTALQSSVSIQQLLARL